MKRRSFLSVAAGSVAAGPFVFTRKSLLWAAGGASTIVIVYNPRASALSGESPEGVEPFVPGTYTVSQAEVNRMVDALVLRLTGAGAVGTAWEQIVRTAYPSLSATTEIGIKINTAVGHPPAFPEGYPADKRCPYAARGEVVNAILSGLAQMLGGTYRIEKVTVFDRLPSYGSLSTFMTANGFPAGGSSSSYDIPAASGRPRYVLRPNKQLSAYGFSVPPTGPYGTSFSQKFLDVVTQQKVWLNLSIPKVNIGAGVTASMKNTYGMTNDCGQSHPEPFEESVIHDCVPLFYKETAQRVPCALNILDALAGNYAKEAYYGPSFVANTIAASTDPVTTDFYAVELVNRARVQNGWAAIQTPAYDTNQDSAARYVQDGAVFPGTANTSTGKAARFAKYVNCHSIGVAANLGLGYANAGERLLVDQTSAGAGGSAVDGQRPIGRLLSVSRGRSSWRIDVQLDRTGREHEVRARIVDATGSQVRCLPTARTRSQFASVEWDGRNERGVSVARGLYCCEAIIDGDSYHAALHH